MSRDILVGFRTTDQDPSDVGPPLRAQTPNLGREVNLDTLRAGTLEGPVFREDNMAALLTNLPPIL